MRILTGIDVPFNPFGGSLICTDDWYSDLPDDVEVRYLTLPPTVNEKWWSIKDVVLLDVEKSRTPDGFMDYVEKLKILLQEQINDFKPDVIHCQHLNYGLSRAIAELETDIPCIGICHGTDVQTATGNAFFKDNLIKICDAMDMLVFPNQTMADDFFSLYGKKAPYIISPLGIPDEYFDITPRNALLNTDRPLQLLYAGRLLAWKGADIAVESMAHITHDAKLTVIGNEDQAGYVDMMHSTVREYKLEDRVTFRPQLSRKELLDEFINYDVIILPSRSLEAFSLTVVEAQAKGLPVIFNPGGGITDTVGESGIKISDNSPKGVAKLIDELCENPTLLYEARSRGYDNAVKYKLSSSKERLFSISRDLLGRHED
jgi:glycosyltransferase involved in cell wall biosynthesis